MGKTKKKASKKDESVYYVFEELARENIVIVIKDYNKFIEVANYYANKEEELLIKEMTYNNQAGRALNLNTAIVIFLREKNGLTLLHEIIHALQFLLEKLNIDDQEFEAYYYSYLVNKIIKKTGLTIKGNIKENEYI